MKQKMSITQEDYIKANRKASREEEISLYGKQIYNRHLIHKSKKAYNRRRDKKIPSFFIKSIKCFQYFVIYTHKHINWINYGLRNVV